MNLPINQSFSQSINQITIQSINRNEYRVLPPHLRAKIEGLHTHKELYEAVGGPYYQILPVGSIVYPGMLCVFSSILH